MHSALLTALLLQTALFVSISSTEELDAGDVPSACSTICQPIVQLTNICDVDPRPAEDSSGENDGDDNALEPDEAFESQCICTNTSFNVSSIAALCASCLQQNANGTVDDMNNIMSACSFSSTSYAPSVTALVAQITVTATKPVTTGTGAASSASTGQGATQTAAVADSSQHLASFKRTPYANTNNDDCFRIHLVPNHTANVNASDYVASHRVSDQDASVASVSADNGGEFFRQRRGYGEYDDAEEDVRDANLTDEVGCYVREDVATEKNGEIAEYTKVNVIGDAVLGIPVGMPGRVSAVPLSLRLTVEAA